MVKVIHCIKQHYGKLLITQEPFFHTGNQIAPCEGHCESMLQTLTDRCHLQELMQMKNITEKNPLFHALKTLNCSDSSTYLIPTVLVENTTCMDLFPAADIPPSNTTHTVDDEEGTFIGKHIQKLYFIDSPYNNAQTSVSWLESLVVYCCYYWLLVSHSYAPEPESDRG